MLEKRSNGIHWLAPATIATSVLIGAILSLGHHLFYSSLEGTAVGDGDLDILGSRVSRQQLNLAGGTAFTFLVKAALTTAVSTAYIQLFWRAATHTAKPPTLATLDTGFAALSNIFLLLKVWFWWHYPLLLFLALTAWLIPIASIISPATLSVMNAPVTPPVSHLIHVPNIDFVNLNYVADMAHDILLISGGYVDMSQAYYYSTPSRAVQEVVQGVAVGGSILPISPPRVNTSWVLEFPGPALQCNNVTSPFRAVVEQNIGNGTVPYTCRPAGYVAWTGSKRNNTGPLPFSKAGNGSYILASNTLSEDLDFYIATAPSLLQVFLNGNEISNPVCYDYPPGHSPGAVKTRASYFANSNMIHCKMFNATYRTSFDYTGGTQNIELLGLTITQPTTPMTMVSSVLGPGESRTRCNSTDPCCVLNDSREASLFNETVLSTLSYQAILDAFGSRILGQLYSERTPAAVFSTRVQYTQLVNAPELHFLTEPQIVNCGYEGAPNLQQAALATNDTYSHGLVSSTMSSMPLARIRL